jgi:hypothetical protein
MTLGENLLCFGAHQDAIRTTIDLGCLGKHAVAGAQTHDPERDIGFQNGPALLHDHVPVGRHRPPRRCLIMLRPSNREAKLRFLLVVALQ